MKATATTMTIGTISIMAIRTDALEAVGQECVAVRDTHSIAQKNPLPFFAVKQGIEAALSAHAEQAQH